MHSFQKNNVYLQPVTDYFNFKIMKKITHLFAVTLIALTSFAQSAKKSMDYDAFDNWKRITERIISNDGNWAACRITPAKGDALVKLYNKSGEEKASFDCAGGIEFSHDAHFLIFSVTQPEDTLRMLKLKKTRREDIPLNKLAIHNTNTNSTQYVEQLKSYKLPAKWSGWIAYQTHPKAATNSTTSDTSENAEEKNTKKEKEVSDKNGYPLTLQNLSNQTTVTFPFVTGYVFAEEEKCLVYVTTGDEQEVQAGVYHYQLESGATTTLLAASAVYKQLSINKTGSRAAFLVNEDEKNTDGNNYALWYWQAPDEAATKVASSESEGLPEHWIINEYGALSFGEKTGRLFFGASPAIRQKDTTLLDDERSTVDVWHWQEEVLQSMQVVNKNNDLRKTYLAVYHPDKNTIIQLASPDMPNVQLIDEGDHTYAVSLVNKPYQLESMWRGRTVNDLYLIDITTGVASLIKKQLDGRPAVSPAFQYLFWYHAPEGSWFTYHIANGMEVRVTSPLLLPCHDELNDVPDFPGSYSYAGWTKDDKAFLVYDRYNIWKVQPNEAAQPINLTINGHGTKTSYRLLRLDRDQTYIDETALQMLTGFNQLTKESAFYSSDFRTDEAPQVLLSGNFALNNLIKAKNDNTVIYTQERFDLFPDLLLSDLTFKKSVKLTDANPQQSNYIWGTAELVEWTSLDGKPLEGLLIKPENFDHRKQYPMIVNFYERSSDGLHNHRTPEAHRSTIDYHYYSSNGYLIFNPDIVYEDGYPGESAYNCAMPGIMMLIEKGFVDKNRIGAQGHSWGGYQVAYLATRTDIFAAIESGAPVVNMFSAYGGIRWETGLNRAFQYEHGQSRIGAGIWESPLRYIENSPLFFMDKVNTPILIMANDQDGHVPWYQGIEYFIALRRLKKPAWLLNYSGEPHWPLTYANRKDFQIRMSQFFNHYLKGDPMPEWMANGRPAIDKDFNTGYEIVD